MFSAKITLFIFSVAVLAASGARVNVARSRISSDSDNGESMMRSEWASKEVFFCLKGGTEEHQHWCLASYTQIFAPENAGKLMSRSGNVATPAWMKMTDAKECYSRTKTHTVKICELETREGDDPVLNYEDRYLAPKRCFHTLGASMQSEGGTTASRVVVLKAAVDHHQCAKLGMLPEAVQNEFSNDGDTVVDNIDKTPDPDEDVFKPEHSDTDADSEDEDPDTTYSVGKITMVPYVIAKWKRRTWGREAFTSEQCLQHIKERAEAIGYRVNLWLQPFGCGAGPLVKKRRNMVLTDDGEKKVCSRHCLGKEELAIAAANFRDLKRKCRDRDSKEALKEAMNSLKVHNYLQDIWQNCPPVAPAPPKMEPVNEPYTGTWAIMPYVPPVNYGLPTTDSGGDDGYVKPGRKPSVDDLVDFVPDEDESTIGSELIPQMIAAKEFADALRDVAQKTCTKLREAFQTFDFRHTGRLTWKQIADQIPRMNEYRQKEAREEFERVQESAINTDFITFLDFADQKLPITKSLRCYNAYAEGRDDSGI